MTSISQNARTLKMSTSPRNHYQHKINQSYIGANDMNIYVSSPVPSVDVHNGSITNIKTEASSMDSNPHNVSNTSSSMKFSSSHHHQYHHGTRPSLAGFDPFSSEQQTPPPTKSIAPDTRGNSSPSGEVDLAFEGADSGYSKMEKHRPHRLGLGNVENFDNEQVDTNGVASAGANPSKKTTSAKGPMKKVNKFLRKSILAKSLTMARQISAERNPSTQKTPSAVSPVSVVSLNDNVSNPGNNDEHLPGKQQMTASTITTNPKGMPSSFIHADQSPSLPSQPLVLSKGPTSLTQDLLELKEGFQNHATLEIPLLTTPHKQRNKPNYAPTSFLTGTQSKGIDYEAPVLTSCLFNDATPFQLEIPSLLEVVTMARLNEFVENYRKQDQNLDLRQFVGLSRLQLEHKLQTSCATTSNHSSNKNIATSNNILVKEHIPIVQSLLDCSEHDHDEITATTNTKGGEISIQGFTTESGGENHSADDRTEAVIFQGQRNFTVVFRGTTEQQAKGLQGGGNNSKSKKRAVDLNDDENGGAEFPDHNNNNPNSRCTIEVYSGFKESYSRIEEECFRQVDKLVDENPFCDVFFSGYSFGGALATLAAFRYAKARPMMRVGCLTLGSPKAGFTRFRQAANALPNLKVMRLELGKDAKCQGPTAGGSHAGHTVVLNHTGSGGPTGSSGSNPHNKSNAAGKSTGGGNAATPPVSQGPFPSSPSDHRKPSVSVYKFATPKHKNGFFKSSNPGLKKYISTLEDLATLNKTSGRSASSLTWATDFANNAGEGVVVNNEKRQMV